MNPWDNYTSGQDWWKQQTANYSPWDSEDMYNMTFRGGHDTGKFQNGQPIYSPYFSQWESKTDGLANPDAYYGLMSQRMGGNAALQNYNKGYETRNGIKYSGLSIADRLAGQETPTYPTLSGRLGGFFRESSNPPMYSGRNMWDTISTTRGY